MKNYKALKTAKSVSVAKVKVVDIPAITEVKDSDGKVVREAVAEQSHDELHVIKKQYDSSTGKALDDVVQGKTLSQVAEEITYLKKQIADLENDLADSEELEKDLKAL